MHEKSRSRAFEVALRKSRHAFEDRSLLAASAHRVFDASLQLRTKDFFMHVLGHDSAEGLGFRTNKSEHCGVIRTTPSVRHEDIR